MDFEAMKTLITVIDLKSFTKASKTLNLSQPTVSFHIKNLEEYFQTTLIDRSPKRFHVTDTGSLVYQRARQILGIIENTRSEVLEHQHQLRGVIRIGASYTVGEYILPALLKEFDSRYPSVDLDVQIANTEIINEAVHLHERDLGLVEGQVNHTDLTSVPFLEDEMVILVPGGHSLWKVREATFQDLQDQTWITREAGSGSRAVMDSMLESYNIRPKKMITIGSNHGVVQAVKEGLGITLVSKTVVDHSDVTQLMLPLPFIKRASRYFSRVTRSGNPTTKNVEVFIQLVDELFHL